MSEHPHKKNRQPLGTPPNKRRIPKPGRTRLAKNYDAVRKAWGHDSELAGGLPKNRTGYESLPPQGESR